jgi:uncharacterized protein YjiK
MKNYDQIVNHFRNDDRNKGLEGITINFNNDHVFIIKEGKPGLLIELDSECKKILNCCELTEECGFKHRRLKSKKLDFSGLSYDHSRMRFGLQVTKVNAFSNLIGTRRGF